jgi:DNA-binding protein YbaB
MNSVKQQQLQTQWATEQKNIRETIESPNKEISITINGNVEIISLKIQDNLHPEILESLLISFLNLGIKSVSLKAQQEVAQFRKKHDF